MESLKLPKELFWSGKMEPFSPENQLFSFNCIEEDWTTEEDTVCLKLEKPGNDDELVTPIILDEELTKQLFKELEKMKSDDIPLSPSSSDECEQWTDSFQNVDVPSMMNIPIDNSFYYNDPQNAFVIQNQGMDKYYQQPNELTPPHSPPLQYKEDYVIQNLLSQQEPELQLSEIQTIQLNDFNNFPITSLSPGSSEQFEYIIERSPTPEEINEKIARNTEIVDEILRTVTENLPDYQNDEDDRSTSYMDDDSSWSAPSPSSDHSSIGSPSSSISSVGKISHKNSSEKKRTRPYGRGPEERKSRKKEQNKNAATRYRQKKKEEMKSAQGEETGLTEKNEELSKVVAEYEKEVKYLKTLIREFYRKK